MQEVFPLRLHDLIYHPRDRTHTAVQIHKQALRLRLFLLKIFSCLLKLLRVDHRTVYGIDAHMRKCTVIPINDQLFSFTADRCLWLDIADRLLCHKAL